MATTPNGRSGGPPRIEAIDRAMQLLEELAKVGADGTSLTELSDVTNISKPTAYRALTTMRARGFVSQGHGGEYRLGPHALVLSDSYFSKDNLELALHPVLLELSRRTEELVHLGAWDGPEVVYLDKVEPTVRAIRVWSQVGQRVPAASSSLGRALLSAGYETQDDLRYFIDSLPPDRNVTHQRLVEAIDEARATGFSWEYEENEPGVACMGFPLMRGNRAVAAISITSVSDRMTPDRRGELQALVRTELPRLLPEGIILFKPTGMPAGA